MRRPSSFVAAALVLAVAPVAVSADPWPAIPIPPGNAANLVRPAPRPPPGDVEARARRLFDALQRDTPEAAAGALDFFLPREPFLAIKDMSGAAGYFRVLVREYERDIRRYRAASPAVAGATFVRFELSRACTWMAPGREANRLPYWSCYHSRLVVRGASGRERALDVRTMIHWGDRWYVTHLGPRAP